MRREITWDVRLTSDQGGLSLLVLAPTDAEARGRALADCRDYTNVSVLWCIEYPPGRQVRHTRALTDD